MSNFKKDPDATLDFAFDWSSWLATDETISTRVVTLSSTDISQSSTDTESSGVVTAWITGGVDDTWYTLACKITTNAGRTDERTMNILVKHR